jgi:hypothetical protein
MRVVEKREPLDGWSLEESLPCYDFGAGYPARVVVYSGRGTRLYERREWEPGQFFKITPPRLDDVNRKAIRNALRKALAALRVEPQS